MYDIKPGASKKKTEHGCEKCILCGKKTKVKSNQEIENRDYYVKGIGQLCKECYQDL